MQPTFSPLLLSASLKAVRRQVLRTQKDDFIGPVDGSETFNECTYLDKQIFCISARNTDSSHTDKIMLKIK